VELEDQCDHLTQLYEQLKAQNDVKFGELKVDCSFCLKLTVYGLQHKGKEMEIYKQELKDAKEKARQETRKFELSVKEVVAALRRFLMPIVWF